MKQKTWTPLWSTMLLLMLNLCLRKVKNTVLFLNCSRLALPKAREGER